MRKHLTYSRVAASTVALILTAILAAAPLLAQDISGGAGVLVASADVEAKLGKGIFTPAQNKPIALRSDWAEAYRALGTAYLKTPRSAEAFDALKKSFDLDSKNPETRSAFGVAYFNRGVIAYNEEKYEDAIAAYQQAVSLKANYADAYSNLGDAYRRLDKLPEAADAYQHAVAINPNMLE